MRARRALLLAGALMMACDPDPGAVASGPEAGLPLSETGPAPPETPYVLVLGIAQDGGFPQIGTPPGPHWQAANRRLVSSLGLVDPSSGERWLFDATPDVAEQLARLEAVAGPRGQGPIVDGILLTHAHIGHYAGLLQFGREALGASGVDVYAMPRMRAFLESNGPWAQLVELSNIRLRSLAHGTQVRLNDRLSVTPLLVPHRDEYSETVGFVIDGPGARALYLPDIDKWERWDAAGTRLEAVLERVDVAWIDGTFMRDGEIPGRAMSEIPHPFMVETMQRIEERAPHLAERVRFIHLNRTNPALLERTLGPSGSGGEGALNAVERGGFRVAREGELWAFPGS